MGGNSIVIGLDGSGLSLRVLGTRDRLTRGRSVLHGARVSVRRSHLGGDGRRLSLSRSIVAGHHSCRRRRTLRGRRLGSHRRCLGTGRSCSLTIGGRTLVDGQLGGSTRLHHSRVSRVNSGLRTVRGGIRLIHRHGRGLGVHDAVSNRVNLLSIRLKRDVRTKRGVKIVGSLDSFGIRTRISRRCVSQMGPKLATAFSRGNGRCLLRIHGICPRMESNEFHVSFVFGNIHPNGVQANRACCMSLRLNRSGRTVVVPGNAFCDMANNR